MLDRFRLPLICLSALIFVYGGWMFWGGKSAVDAERATRKPRPVTLDELVLDPPKKVGEWVSITDGDAYLARAVVVQDKVADVGARYDSGPFMLYIPLLPSSHVGRTGASGEAEASGEGDFFIVIRSIDKQRKESFRQMRELGTPGSRKIAGATATAWLTRNRAELVIPAPFTGTLVPRKLETFHGGMPDGSGFHEKGWVLLENRKPPIVDNAQLALGLMLVMGVPTVWIFALLLTGKLNPPDDDPLAMTDRSRPVATTAVTDPSTNSSVMPGAMPLEDEPTKKTPRR